MTRLREHELHGWRALDLESDAVSVTVLPDKGADIYALVDRAAGVDLLMKTPWGLQPPGAPPREGSEGMAFLHNYEGAWQELLPNANDACTVDGRQHPFHGDVATRGWSCEMLDEEAGPALRLAVDCVAAPLHLERTMRLTGEGATLELDEAVTNRGEGRERFVWGHHCVLGAPLVGEGARLETSARSLLTPGEAWEETARLELGQRGRWPHARLRDGAEVDLSRIPGPEAESHDDVFLHDLDGGRAEVRNDALGLGLRLEWDPRVFRWIIAWQPYGGTRALPLRGTYGLGVEPWAFGGNLAQAVAAGEALELAPGETLRTAIRATVTGAAGSARCRS